MKATNNKIKGMSTQAFAKKGYKKTKLGWIPEEWEIIKLGGQCYLWISFSNTKAQR